MNPTTISLIGNALAIIAFLIDRVYRIRALKETEDANKAMLAAKDATIQLKEEDIKSLKFSLDFLIKNNDVELTEQFKKRYEDLKIIVAEQEEKIKVHKALLDSAEISLETTRQATQTEVTSKFEKIIEELKNELELEREKLGAKREQLNDISTEMKKIKPMSIKGVIGALNKVDGQNIKGAI